MATGAILKAMEATGVALCKGDMGDLRKQAVGTSSPKA